MADLGSMPFDAASSPGSENTTNRTTEFPTLNESEPAPTYSDAMVNFNIIEISEPEPETSNRDAAFLQVPSDFPEASKRQHTVYMIISDDASEVKAWESRASLLRRQREARIPTEWPE